MGKQKNTIGKGLYKKILEVLPIPCVDMVIEHGGKFLLCRRKNKPMKGAWWLIGGRVHKNETLKKAVLRKDREETGVTNAKIEKFLTTEGAFFKNSEFGPSTHSINSVFVVEATPPVSLAPDSQNFELKWFSKIEKSWHRYVREMLIRAGFKE